MWKYLAILGCIVFAAYVHSAPQAAQAPPAEAPQPVTRKGLFLNKQIIFGWDWRISIKLVIFYVGFTVLLSKYLRNTGGS